MNKTIKTTKILTSILAMLMVMAFAQSCSDNDANPLSAEAALTFKAKTSNSAIVNGRTQATGLEFTTILLGMTELELEKELADTEIDSLEEEDDDIEIEFEGAFIVDLVNGTSTPDFGFASLVPDTYDEIEIEFGPVLPDGNTVFIEFDYTPEGEVAPLTVQYSNNYELEFELENAQGIDVPADDITQLIVVLDLDLLFAEVDLSTASVDQDGVIRINASSNAAIAAQIAAALDTAIEGGEDDDDDGEIDD